MNAASDISEQYFIYPSKRSPFLIYNGSLEDRNGDLDANRIANACMRLLEYLQFIQNERNKLNLAYRVELPLTKGQRKFVRIRLEPGNWFRFLQDSQVDNVQAAAESYMQKIRVLRDSRPIDSGEKHHGPIYCKYRTNAKCPDSDFCTFKHARYACNSDDCEQYAIDEFVIPTSQLWTNAQDRICIAQVRAEPIRDLLIFPKEHITSGDFVRSPPLWHCILTAQQNLEALTTPNAVEIIYFNFGEWTSIEHAHAHIILSQKAIDSIRNTHSLRQLNGHVNEPSGYYNKDLRSIASAIDIPTTRCKVFIDCQRELIIDGQWYNARKLNLPTNTDPQWRFNFKSLVEHLIDERLVQGNSLARIYCPLTDFLSSTTMQSLRDHKIKVKNCDDVLGDLAEDLRRFSSKLLVAGITDTTLIIVSGDRRLKSSLEDLQRKGFPVELVAWEEDCMAIQGVRFRSLKEICDRDGDVYFRESSRTQTN